MAGAGEDVSLVVEDGDRAAQDVGDDSGDVCDPAAVQEHVGQPVVRVRGHLDGRRLGAHLPVDPVDLLEQPGVLQRHGGVRGEGRQQRDLGGREAPHAAVHREQGAR